ncbi:MAG: ester cyclase [Saprospiraceae bacterium]|nr:ester cyclase [Saprospiraceae bacterium]
MRTIPCFFFLAFSLLSLSLGAQTPAQNKQTAAHILGAVDSGDVSMYSKHVHPNMKHHMSSNEDMSAQRGASTQTGSSSRTGMGDKTSDFEASKTRMSDMHKSFPDSKTTIEKMVAEGDIVMVYSTRTGTNKGEFRGNPATNRPVTLQQFDMLRFDASGKAVEHWSVSDNLSMMQQMGMMHEDKTQIQTPNQNQKQTPYQKQTPNQDMKQTPNQNQTPNQDMKQSPNQSQTPNQKQKQNPDQKKNPDQDNNKEKE